MTIEEVETYFGRALPSSYKDFLAARRSKTNEDIHLYSLEDLVERNECYETKGYAPGYINIGDDGGGQAFILNLAEDDPEVSIVGHGSMDPALKELVYKSFSSWVASGFKYNAE